MWPGIFLSTIQALPSATQFESNVALMAESSVRSVIRLTSESYLTG